MLELYEVLNGPTLEQNPEKKKTVLRGYLVHRISSLIHLYFISGIKSLSFKVMLHKRLLKNYQ